MSHVKGHYRIVEGKLVWVNEHEREGGAGEKFSLFGDHFAKKEEPAPAPEPPKQEPKPEPKAEPKPKVSTPKPDQEVAATGSDLDHGLEAPESKEDLTKQHFTDVGKKIGGAAKDMAALKAKYYKQKLSVTLDDLESMEAESPELAHQLLTKEQQLGTKSDFLKQMKNQGATPGCAYIAGRLYTAIGDPIDTPAGRKAFALGLNRLQKATSSWHTLEDAVEGLKQLRDEVSGFWMTADKKATYDGLIEAYKQAKHDHLKGLTDPNGTNSATLGVLAKAMSEAHMAVITFGKQAIKDGDADPDNPKKNLLALGLNFKKLLTDKSRIKDLAKKSVEVEKKEGWAFMEKKASEAGGEAKEKVFKPWHNWVKPETDELVKEGGVPSQIYVAQTLADTFGIKGVEYGNWMDKDASQHHTQACGEALADLAFVLGMDPKEVSLNGRLSMAFGARGKGGAKAHYEPAKKVVNLTKMKGGGSLAHEWGHALDNIMALVSTGGQSHQMALITDMNGIAPGDQMPQEVKDAFKGVYDAMHQGSFQAYSTETYHPHGEANLAYYAKKALEQAGGDPQAALDIYSSQYLSFDKKYHPKKYAQKMKIAAQGFANASGKPVEIKTPVGKPTSHFVATGNMMGEYWGRKPELFARAWESFVMDKMTEKGMKNTYLVSGVLKENAEAYGKILQVLEPHGGKTSVYPLGEERQNINAAFEKLVAALNTHKMFAKAISILNMRSLFN